MPLQEEITPIDEHFGRLIGRLGGGPRVQEAARLVSAARGVGHTCLPLGELDGGAAAWREELRTAGVVGAPGAWQPLILDEDDRLYLQRYWQYEQALAESIRTRLAAPAATLEAAAVERALETRLPKADARAGDQRRAVEAALQSHFCVITGGPGTGKTRTVSVILQMLEQLSPTPLRVKLAAPTGKAAARMTEALSGSTSQSAVTLHRLLGLRAESGVPRHDAAHPLPADVVIVDEASMIDLALMAKLFAAVPPEARLILLGDRDQLASVEAGHVLGDISEAASHAPASFVTLRENFRFGDASGIQQLSAAVNAGESEAALALLKTAPAGLRSRALPSPPALALQLREHILQAHRRTVQATDPAAALQVQGEFRILCAIRGGPYGVEHLNRLAESILAPTLQMNGAHYPGRPIMILQNDYNLGLFNGDLGLLLPDPANGGALRAWFPAPGKGVRSIHPARLPEHETVWAMTVHKSQGSEFDHVLLLLPERDTAVLTRELLYTGLTRARTEAELWYQPALLRAAIGRRTVRFSGLPDLLRTGPADHTASGRSNKKAR